eukprot:NODE_710_length_1405_cov_49.289823_g525_i0.p1 GENE.NODE_710_length_1405_cov_49.289823_g525_i0~~NODE_710_length_1405_cov_49.289823_g525_i0.p1  ORF type:complete len:313 (-),score=36.52 NODE_710_length_1405_cov_49.289823_g525_i0:285-1223(-)
MDRPHVLVGFSEPDHNKSCPQPAKDAYTFRSEFLNASDHGTTKSKHTRFVDFAKYQDRSNNWLSQRLAENALTMDLEYDLPQQPKAPQVFMAKTVGRVYKPPPPEAALSTCDLDPNYKMVMKQLPRAGVDMKRGAGREVPVTFCDGYNPENLRAKSTRHFVHAEPTRSTTPVPNLAKMKGRADVKAPESYSAPPLKVNYGAVEKKSSACSFGSVPRPCSQQQPKPRPLPPQQIRAQSTQPGVRVKGSVMMDRQPTRTQMDFVDVKHRNLRLTATNTGIRWLLGRKANPNGHPNWFTTPLTSPRGAATRPPPC